MRMPAWQPERRRTAGGTDRVVGAGRAGDMPPRTTSAFFCVFVTGLWVMSAPRMMPETLWGMLGGGGSCAHP